METRASNIPATKATAAVPEAKGPGEATLVAAARNGSAGAFEAIMRRHNRKLFRTARAILQNEADAEEVVQETYLKAFLNLDGFQGQARLSTWLVRIAVNEALSRLRRRSGGGSETFAESQMNSDSTIPVPGFTARVEDSPEASAAQSELRRLIETAIDALPQAQRTVFMLRAVEEFSTEDTATCLGIPPETVKTRLHRARKQLRGCLQRQVTTALVDTFPFAGARCDRIVTRVLEQLGMKPPDG